MKNSEQLLRSKGLRVTPARAKVLQRLAQASAPLSADEIHATIGSVDIVTVYRTLQAFVQAGIARDIRFRDGVARYEAVDGPHHHHIVCMSCGVIDELPRCDSHTLEAHALAASKRFTKVDEHALEFFGTCTACSAR